MPVGNRVPAFWCVRDWHNPTLWQLHEVYCLLLILVLPTAVMVFTYSVVCWEVWHVMLMRYHMTSGQGLSPSKPAESVPLSKKQRQVHVGAAGVGAGTGARPEKKTLKLEEDSQTVKQVRLVSVHSLASLFFAAPRRDEPSHFSHSHSTRNTQRLLSYLHTRFGNAIPVFNM